MLTFCVPPSSAGKALRNCAYVTSLHPMCQHRDPLVVSKSVLPY